MYDESHYTHMSYDDKDFENLSNHPADSDDDSLTDMSMHASPELKKRLKQIEEVKRLDKGYNKVYRWRTVTGVVKGIKSKRVKKIDIEYYATFLTPGSIIRNAISGGYEKGLHVGFSDEDLFFKVRLASDKCDDKVRTLFFDSPEQYERHFGVSISPEAKSAWLDKFTKERIRKENEKPHRRNFVYI
jgi:hypothetical protein